ncbi:hypothetical protein [Sphingomonas sp. SORGH_AS_0879]|uniref:hypothetical protein n=1 Tax=Sphingomonas sp. SORGH_AS_0879 TaxID=3041790 RepID=UPI0027D84E37|nr:hypothetical protein [Sphingomonas sp. SORGH_AS_0879]
MSDDIDDGNGILKGDLMKVIHVDDLSGTVYLRLFDGRTSRITGLAEGTLHKNDVILSDGNDWRVVPNELWPTSFLTSVVRDVLEDGTVLGESGSELAPISTGRI